MEEFSSVVHSFENQKDQHLSDAHTTPSNYIQPILNKSVSQPFEQRRDDQLEKYISLNQICSDSLLGPSAREVKFISPSLDGHTNINLKTVINPNGIQKSISNQMDNYNRTSLTTSSDIPTENTFNNLIFRTDSSFTSEQITNAQIPYNTSGENINEKNVLSYNKRVQDSNNSNAIFFNCSSLKDCDGINSSYRNHNESHVNYALPVCNIESDVSHSNAQKKEVKMVQQGCQTNLSTESDSTSSSDIIDLEIREMEALEGYQDNTSSHSQQSVGGNGSIVGNNGPNSAGNSSSNGGGGIGSVLNANPNSGYISLIPPPVGTTGSAIHGGEGIDFKHLFEELCPVCGDKVSGYHYGLLTCESCKGFFKRTVQNKKVYTCVAERSCHIDKTQRKRCPYCRFQKCLEVGMKLEAVRADRMRGGRNKFGPMYKRDRARKLQMMRQRQLALQAIRTTIGSTDIKGPLSPTTYQQPYPNMNIKQEIQIPQVSSLTQSPDSSPSPIAIALGQVHQSTGAMSNALSGSNATSAAGSSNTNDNIGRNEPSTCPDGASVNMQHTNDSKICFDSGNNPSSTADTINNVEPLRVSPMIRDFVQSIDDREWQTQLFALLQKQSYNQVEVDLFELMCKVLDQNLFSQVDWARNTVFFKDLKVDDQMKLLQHSWSDMLVLDHLHQRIHNGLPDETQLNNGQLFNLLSLGLLGVPQLSDYFNELQNKLQDLKFDMGDYVCMKFLILLNPNVRGIINRKTVLEGHENVQAALLDYTLTCYPSVTDKFSRLLNILPEIHAMAARGEEHLYLKHCAGSAPTQTLLMEMLHAKRKV